MRLIHPLYNQQPISPCSQAFHVGGTLTTKLKTAHDFKLTMRTQYQLTNPLKVVGEAKTLFDWPKLITLGR